MHHYSTTPSDERMKIYCIIIVVSFLLSAITYFIKDPWPWWLQIIPMPGSLVALRFIFKRWLWKLSQLKTLGLVCIPDLDGEWAGKIRSGACKGLTELECKVTIRQDWERIAITLETEHSKSRSRMAFFNTGDAEGTELTYLYINEPSSNPDVAKTMHIHYGTASLTIKENFIEGYYYTGRDRRTFGSLRLERKVSDNIL